MSRRLVQRVSRVVDRHASRRGFLRTSAMTATAMAVAPVAFAVRPTTAEAAIVTCAGQRCRSGTACCQSWSEFCCRITGENACPPGTVAAGWWKVDNSDFCSLDEPRPRYYIDCNVECDPACRCYGGMCSRSCTSARCRCSDGCDTRRTECLRFRYGQCNQDVCVGAISCRVVTCVPPWQWDSGCLSAPALRNESTRRHDLPCLHEGFNDVPPKAFYAEAVRWMADEGIADGLKSDLFGPHEPVSRAQFSTFLWRYSGEPAPAAGLSDDGSASRIFKDVPAGSEHEEAVLWIWGQRIAVGLAPREFGPDEPMTIEHAVVCLHRLAGSPRPLPSGDAAGEEDEGSDGGDGEDAAGDRDGDGDGDGEDAADDVTDSLDWPPRTLRASAGEDGLSLATLPVSPASISSSSGLSLVPFNASDEDRWYSDALRWALEQDIVWWYPHWPFGGELPINRAFAALLMHRYHQSRSLDSDPESDDSPKSDDGPNIARGLLVSTFPRAGRDNLARGARRTRST